MTEWNLIFWGMIFLFQPIVNVVDLLPDFLGYIMILMGLRRLRDFSSDLEECRRPFQRLLAISAGRTVISIVMLNGQIGSYLMIFTFVFSLLELICAISAFPKLFNGLYFVGAMYNCNALTHSCGKLSTLTLAFFSVRALSAVGPDLLLYLFVNEEGSALLNAYRFPMYLICFGITFLFGIVWLVCLMRLRRKTTRDRCFLSALDKRYAELTSCNQALHLRRSLSSGFSFFVCGTVFFLDLYIDGIDCLPDFFAPLFFLPAFLYLRRNLAVSRWQIVLCVPSAVIAGVAWGMHTHFASRYFGAAFSRLPNVMQQLSQAETVYCISRGLLLLLLLSFTKPMRQTVQRYACHQNTAALESITARDATLQRSYHWRYWLFSLLAIVSSVLSAITAYRLFFDNAFPFYGAAAAIALIVFTALLCSRIRENVAERNL